MDFTKQPSEIFPFKIDYTPWMSPGEVLVSGVVFVNESQVTIPHDLISSYAIVDSTFVSITVHNGIDGQDYKITSRVFTNHNEIYEFDVLLRVREDAAAVFVNDNFSYRIRANGLDNILYLVPTVGSTLGFNTEYTVKIKAGIGGILPDGTKILPLQKTHEIKFTSQFCPLFTTVTKVKLEIGPKADYFLDDAIYRIIHKNSMDAIDIWNQSKNASLTYYQFGCTYEQVPYILRRYVECKTAYDLLSLLDILNNGNGDQLKTLGDMTIKYGADKGANAGQDPSKKKQLYDCWNELLRQISNIRTAVRGLYDTSKGFAHPALEPEHNRVIRPVPFNNNTSPAGPWWNGRPWRGVR